MKGTLKVHINPIGRDLVIALTMGLLMAVSLVTVAVLLFDQL